MEPRYLFTVETIFCDNESDLEIRRLYLTRWLKSLSWMAKVEIPSRVDLYHFLYISSDKIEEIKVITDLLNNFEPSVRERFKLVEYRHPAEGYSVNTQKHPDSIKNPNKVAPRRDDLFKKAWGKLPEITAERVIRATLDDDDFWLPWQVEEMVRVADLAFEEETIIGVGLRKACIAYVQEHRGDVVEMTHHMNGNKFYLSSMKLWERQSELSPWSIPEDFSEQNVARMARAGVRLKTSASNRPGWIYGRWGSNLSLHDKTRYYARRYFAFPFSDEDNLVFEAERRIKTWFDGETVEMRVESKAL